MSGSSKATPDCQGRPRPRLCHDVAACRRITAEAWAARPWSQRVGEALSHALQLLW